jgi:hypothetical protein
MHAYRDSGDLNDEVIYLRTVTIYHTAQSSSTRSAAGVPIVRQNSDAHANTANQGTPSRKKHTRSRVILTGPRPRTRHGSKSSRRQTTIPSCMVDRLVKLGWSRSGEGGERRAVYGSFSPAGRFCYWLDAAKSVSIAQKNVDYVRRFQGMTRQQVRAAVYEILDVGMMDSGEV